MGSGFGSGSGNGGLMMGRVGGGHSGTQEDQVPLTREIDDFSQGFSAALGRIGEEDEEDDELGQHEPYRDHVGGASSSGIGSGGQGSQIGGGGDGGGGGGDAASTHDSMGSSSGHRPLWQQNRRQSRNLMWM